MSSDALKAPTGHGSRGLALIYMPPGGLPPTVTQMESVCVTQPRRVAPDLAGQMLMGCHLVAMEIAHCESGRGRWPMAGGRRTEGWMVQWGGGGGGGRDGGKGRDMVGWGCCCARNFRLGQRKPLDLNGNNNKIEGDARLWIAKGETDIWTT